MHTIDQSQTTKLNTDVSDGRKPPGELGIWLPCIFVATYLLTSLVLLELGPIFWPIQNYSLFWLLNIAYIVAFCLGYVLCRKLKSRSLYRLSNPKIRPLARGKYWLILILAFVAVLIGHRNITMSSSYLPLDLLQTVIRGLVDPLNAYLYKLSPEATGNFSGNPPVTLIFGLLAVAKLFLVNFVIKEWTNLPLTDKICGLSVSIFPVFSGISVGTNKPIFDVAFAIVTLLIVHTLIHGGKGAKTFLSGRRTLVLFSMLLSAFSVFYFQHTMSARAPGLDYISTLSPEKRTLLNNEGDNAAPRIQLKPGFENFCTNGDEWRDSYCRFASMFSVYLTQGYYGMSLSLGVDFETTYGIGHSRFLLEAVHEHLGVDLSAKTYQAKINHLWNAGQWSSAYSQWANDVSFWGVIIVMFALGYFCCGVWLSALTAGDAVSVTLIPLLAILILFIPANNQIFNGLEHFAAFAILASIWMLEKRILQDRKRLS